MKLHGTRALLRSTLDCRDDELGHLHDLLFDDRDWSVRYVAVETGTWFRGELALVPTSDLHRVDVEKGSLSVDLPRADLEDAPGMEAHPPLARESRLRMYRDFVWTTHPWGGYVGGSVVPAPSEQAGPGRPEPDDADTHLRSVRELSKYTIQAKDGDIGHVEDFLVSVDDWSVRYLVVDTRRWLPGRQVLIPPLDVARMRWGDRRVQVDLTREAIREAPELDETDTSSVRGTRVVEISH